MKAYFYRAENTETSIQGVLSVRWYRSVKYTFSYLKQALGSQLGDNYQVLEFRRVK